MIELPVRRPDETPLAFARRVFIEYHAHLLACPACLNARGCFACEAGEDDCRPEFHACNCELTDPPAYGVQLRKMYVATRPVRLRGRRFAR